MLSYALAIVVAISSLVLFSTAFLMSKIHRRDDFLWSAVGLFYALILWYCARNITGAVLLGQAAATALLVSYSWQTIKLRRIISDPTQAAAANNFSVLGTINGFRKRKKPQAKAEVTPAPATKLEMPKVTEEIAIPEAPETSNQTPETKLTEPVKEIPEQVPQVAEAVSPPVEVPRESENVTTPPVKAPSKAPAPKSTAELPRVSEPAIEAKIDAAASKPLVEIEIIDKAIDANDDTSDRILQQSEAPTQLLPNKLPEVANAGLIPPEENINANSESEQPEETIQNEPTPVPPIEPVKAETASPLDSLETVEVAEVLEAQSDRESNNRRGDRFDEIEVTTTDVDVIAEDIKKDRNLQGESDLNDV